jgi:hypothetical protein
MHKSVEEFSVKTLEIAGLGAALQALRLPFGKEARSDVMFSKTLEDNEYSTTSVVVLDPADISLLGALIKHGDDHAKVMRGVMVWCEINAPRYWHVELDTYRIGCERLSSESTMHINGRGLSDDELIDMKEYLPEGTMQKRVWMFSYQTLRRIYFQRKHHRLPQWQKFCEWIETLPYSKEFITFERDSNNTD